MHKTIKIYIFFVATFIAIAIIANSQAHAQGSNKTYVRMVNTSAKVVRGTIISREEIRYDYDGVNMVCANVLEIAVSQSWKGGNDTFKVFAANADILENAVAGQEYLIMARKNQAFGATGQDAIAFTNCDGERSTRMDMSQFEFLATRLTQQIFPIIQYSVETPVTDEDTGVIKRGEWMMIVDRIANNALPFTIMRRRLNTGNPNVIEEMSYADFLDEFGLES